MPRKGVYLGWGSCPGSQREQRQMPSKMSGCCDAQTSVGLRVSGDSKGTVSVHPGRPRGQGTCAHHGLPCLCGHQPTQSSRGHGAVQGEDRGEAGNVGREGGWTSAPNSPILG